MAKQPVKPKTPSPVALTAPIILFDTVTVFGFHNGVVHMTLEAMVHGLDAKDQAVDGRAVVAHLRATPAAMSDMAKAIGQLQLLAAPAARV